MKKTFAVLLALMLLVSFSVTAAADPFTDGFDPDEVIAGMTALAEEELGKTLTVVPGDYADNYLVNYADREMNGFFFISRTGPTGETLNEGKYSHIGVSVVFTFDESTVEDYLTFWRGLSASVIRYLTGAEFNDLYAKLNAGLGALGNDPNSVYSFSVGGYRIDVGMMYAGNTVLIGTTVDIPGLN